MILYIIFIVYYKIKKFFYLKKINFKFNFYVLINNLNNFEILLYFFIIFLKFNINKNLYI